MSFGGFLPNHIHSPVTPLIGEWEIDKKGLVSAVLRYIPPSCLGKNTVHSLLSATFDKLQVRGHQYYYYYYY